MRYFDSLVHATADGTWLGGTRYDAGIARLLREMDLARVARACLVAIADFADNADVHTFWMAHPDRFVPVGSTNPGKATDPTSAAADIIDRIALECPDTRIVLLHGGASEMLQVFEMVRMHPQLILDISFTLLRYAGSSLDRDIRFVCKNLDQRVTVGSDFPEYTQTQMIEQFQSVTDGLPEDKLARIRSGNLDALFS